MFILEVPVSEKPPRQHQFRETPVDEAPVSTLKNSVFHLSRDPGYTIHRRNTLKTSNLRETTCFSFQTTHGRRFVVKSRLDWSNQWRNHPRHARNAAGAVFGRTWAPSTCFVCRWAKMSSSIAPAAGAHGSVVTGSEAGRRRRMRRSDRDQAFDSERELVRFSNVHNPMLTRKSTGMMSMAVMKSSPVTLSYP